MRRLGRRRLGSLGLELVGVGGDEGPDFVGHVQELRPLFLIKRDREAARLGSAVSSAAANADELSGVMVEGAKEERARVWCWPNQI